jgi:hypothetical protein
MDLDPATAVSDEWDDCSDLTQSEVATAAEWRESFMQKYPVRGPLVKEKTKVDAAQTK